MCRTRSLALLATVVLLLPPAGLAADAHVRLELSSAADPARIGVPIPLTILATDAGGILDTNFTGPVELYFTDNEALSYEADFNVNAAGWNSGCRGGVGLFDTDGDSLEDGALRIPLSGAGAYCEAYTMVPVLEDTTYTATMDLAVVRSSPASAAESLYVDAVLGLGQLGVWTFDGGASGVMRSPLEVAFRSPTSGSGLFGLRYWLPMGGAFTPYLDNVRIRSRQLEPGLAHLVRGRWTGEVNPLRTGSNLVLRARTHAGISGDSRPFTVLPAQADVSVQFAVPPWLPANVETRVSMLISNAGPSYADGFHLTNRWPAGVALIATQPIDHTPIPNGAVYAVPRLNASFALPYQLILRSPSVGPAEFAAQLNAPDPDPTPSNNRAVQSFTFVPLLRGNDAVVTEQPGGAQVVFTFNLSAPSPLDLTAEITAIPQSATPGADYVDPGLLALTFPAGTTQQVVRLTIPDDGVFEPAKTFALQVQVAPNVPLLLERSQYRGTILDDETVPSLTVELPSTVAESAGVLSGAGRLVVSGPLDRDAALNLLSSDLTELTVPAVVVLPAGQTSVTFDLTVRDDTIYDRTQTVTVTAQATNGLQGTAAMLVTDDDLPPLSVTLTLNGAPSENAGTIANAIRVSIPEALSSNLTVTLLSSDGSELQVPVAFELGAGRSSTNQPVTVIDDTETDGPQAVTITASAPGFASGTVVTSVRDNDIYDFGFVFRGNDAGGGVPTRATSTVPFQVTISARDIAKNVLAEFAGPARLEATSDQGPVALSITNLTGLIRGSWQGSVAVMNGAHTNVRLLATAPDGHAGPSAPFTVYAAPHQQLRLAGVRLAGAAVELRFATVAGRNYRVERSDTPSGPAWTTVIPARIGTGEEMTVTVPLQSGVDAGFYRVALQAAN